MELDGYQYNAGAADVSVSRVRRTVCIIDFKVNGGLGVEDQRAVTLVLAVATSATKARLIPCCPAPLPPGRDQPARGARAGHGAGPGAPGSTQRAHAGAAAGKQGGG